jgi:L-asparaginase / beta-aspartyl-peptidase
MSTLTLAIHGGAGTILPSMLTPDLEMQYKLGLQTALDIGYTILHAGGTAVDAVEKTVMSLEDNVLFNAGRGSVFTNTGTHEMDACMMDGSNLAAGAVSGLRGIQHPVSLCRAIMLNSGNVYLSGQGSQDFAAQQGMALLDDQYFFNQYRYDQWQEIKDSEFYQLDHKEDKLKDSLSNSDKKFGTVGAVALDAQGNIAAATSTGGMTNKRYGRVGDTPVIGSGNYANNATCAISCTGHGEFFLRAVVAYDISCLMEYKGYTLQQACEYVVLDKLVTFGGEGGVIAVDAEGNYQLCYNSEGMYRGVRTSAGESRVAIYKD